MGGTVPHGYYVHACKLLVNETEAKAILYTFSRYLKLGLMLNLLDDLAAKGIRTREWTLGCSRKVSRIDDSFIGQVRWKYYARMR